MEENSLDQLLEQLADDNFKLRKAAAEALGDHRSVRAVEALATKLNDEYLLVRLAAVAALSKIGGFQTIPHLIRALKDPDYDVRCGAAEGLARNPDPSAVMALTEVFERPCRPEDGPTRRTVVQALGNIGGPQVVDVLLRALHRNYDEAVPALKKIRDPRIIETAVYALAQEHRCSNAAESLLRALGGDAVESLLPLLRHSNLWVRTRVARLLGTIGDPRAAEPLIGLLEDPEHDVQSAAWVSLQAIAPHLADWHNKDAIRILLRLARVGHTGESSVEALTILAERSVENFSQEDLTALSQLSDVVQFVWRPVREGDYEDNECVERPVDISRLRQIVQNELKRRSLNPSASDDNC